MYGKHNVKERILSWHKLSNKKYTLNIEKYLPIMKDDEQKEYLIEQLRKAGEEKKQFKGCEIPDMPENFEDICKSLNIRFNRLLRPQLYIEHCRAIHPDACLLREFMNTPTLEDTKESAEYLYRFCLVNIFWLIWSIYTYWNWSLDEILAQYQQVCEMLGIDIKVDDLVKKNNE
jgi:hypothetical protein